MHIAYYLISTEVYIQPNVNISHSNLANLGGVQQVNIKEFINGTIFRVLESSYVIRVTELQDSDLRTRVLVSALVARSIYNINSSGAGTVTVIFAGAVGLGLTKEEGVSGFHLAGRLAVGVGGRAIGV